MTRRIKSAPTLKRHKSTGNAYARFNGHQKWFGHFDDPQTHVRFAAFKAYWEANGRELPAKDSDVPALTVADIVALYLRHAEVYYRRSDGSQTQEVANISYSVRPLLERYGSLPAETFDLRCLKEVREAMIAGGLARPTVNIRAGRVIRIFGWAAEEEYVPAEVFGALRALRPLKKGRSKAHETQPVRPVSWEDVEATLPHLSTPVRAMVLLEWWTGMRPGEARQLCPAAIERSDKVWLYRPPVHKTQHFGKERVIALGIRAQEVIRPFLNRVPRPDPKKPLFSPRQAMAERYLKSRLSKGPGSACSNVQGKAHDGPSKRGPSECYTKDSYVRAVTRGCKAAGVDHWSPNQLRHSAATRIRSKLGIEAARVVLGHSSAGITEIYAEADTLHALRVMGELG